jgi:predicted transglutaminase-like cysteine proteinase
MSKRWQHGDSCPLPTNLCTRVGWKELMAQLQGKDPMTQVHMVNDAFNSPRYPYRQDINNWGVPDYYATPYEFLKKSGDCEDYAIAKYMMLRALGFPATSLRLLAVSILSQGGIAHAILLVYLGGKTWVLDILNTRVMDANLIVDYKPLISLNEIDWRLELVN